MYFQRRILVTFILQHAASLVPVTKQIYTILKLQNRIEFAL